MDVFISIKPTTYVLFNYYTMFETPAGSTGTSFDLSVDKCGIGMMKSGGTNRQQIQCAGKHCLHTATPISIPMTRNELGVALNMTLSWSALPKNDRGQLTAATSTRISFPHAA